MKKVEMSALQRGLLKQFGADSPVMEEAELLAIASGDVAVQFLSEEKLVDFLRCANALYRAGYPIIDDARYDFDFLEELRRRAPQHPFLHEVEVEPSPESKTVALPSSMLSTEKAYDFEAIDRWANRVKKAARELGKDFSSLELRLTPKLDGFAAYDDGERLYTRGDGKRGTDISRAFTRGLQVGGGGARGLGAGEIVVDRHYFQDNLAQIFDNSRNFQASLIKEKELDAPVARAVAAAAAVFFPFAMLPDWRGYWPQLASDFEEIVDGVWQLVPYDIDGVVLELLDPELRAHLGATRHHHRWQIAFKRNSDSAEVRILRVVAQTSRSGRINPVAEVEPTRLSGACIQRVTAHHYTMVRDRGIGPGSLIRMSRSGEVIPKIEEVLEGVATEDLQIPQHCPSCGSQLVWEGEYLYCPNNLGCPAQITNSMEHFFKTLGNVDGFGPAAIKKCYDGGVGDLPTLYRCSSKEFVSFGFGPKQSENMVEQLRRSRSEVIEDWRFLAAFGVHRLGMGNAEKLLQHRPLLEIFALDEAAIVEEVEGFQKKSAKVICQGLRQIHDLFLALYNLGFALDRTPLLAEKDEMLSPIAGKTIVFTGAMAVNSRAEMEREAKLLGATVAKAISGKTDMLVTGARVGASKMEKASKLGVQMVSEEAYRELLAP